MFPAPAPDVTETANGSRRRFLRSALAATAGIAAVPVAAVTASAQSFTGSAGSPPSGYGTLQSVSGERGVNGVRLLNGFTIRVIAESGKTVPGTSLPYRGAPDGAATFPDGSGGWYYTVNHELGGERGGVTSFHFSARGRLRGAESILDGTNRNCAGGPTPWGTWLSCEETSTGQVWECWPDGSRPGQVRPAMGMRYHEAVAVDPINRVLYSTEDRGSGKLWRFTPTNYPDLSEGVLERAHTGNRDGTGSVSWKRSGGRPYNGGEGIWFHDETRKVYFSTKGDSTIWELDTASTPNRIEKVWQGERRRTSPLYDPDNLTVADGSGDLFVAEDSGELRVVLITPEGEMSTFLQFTGSEHEDSEVTGPVFNPAGDRMYVSSQRGGPNGTGITYEISGPFRSAAPSVGPTVTPVPEVPPVTPVPEGALAGVLVLSNRAEATSLHETAPNQVFHLDGVADGSTWQFTALTNGNYHVVNTSTGRFLDSDGVGSRVGTSSIASIDDEWRAIPLANGAWLFESAESSGAYLSAAAGDGVRLVHGETGDSAQWFATTDGTVDVPAPGAPPAPPPSDDTPADAVVLTNRWFGSYVLEVEPNKVRRRAELDATGAWQMKPLDNGAFHLVNTVTGSFLDGNGIDASVGTSSEPSTDDEWKLEQLDNGAWLIESKRLPGAYLSAAATEDRLRLVRETGKAAQWFMAPADGAPVPPVPDTTPVPPVADETPEGSVVFSNRWLGSYLLEVSPYKVRRRAELDATGVWQMKPLDNGAFHLVNTVTGSFLDGNGSDASVGTSSEPSTDDEWKLEQLDNGAWLIESKRLPDAYLTAASTEDKLRLVRGETGKAAQWFMMPADQATATRPVSMTTFDPGESLRRNAAMAGSAADRFATSTSGMSTGTVAGAAAAALFAFRNRLPENLDGSSDPV